MNNDAFIKERIENLSDEQLKKEGINNISDYRDDVQTLYKIELKKRGFLSDSESKNIFINDEEYIHKILIDNNLEKYFSLFQKENILSLEILSCLSENDFEKIGITPLGDKKRLNLLFKDKNYSTINFEQSLKNREEQLETKKKSIPFVLFFLFILILSGILFMKNLSSSKKTVSLTSSISVMSAFDGILLINSGNTINNARLHINSDYIYNVGTITQGSFTYKYTQFKNSHGEPFSNSREPIKRISLLSDNGRASW